MAVHTAVQTSPATLQRRTVRLGLSALLVLLALLLSGPRAAHAQTQLPTIRLLPGTVRAGSLIVVAGEGFGADSLDLNVFWDDVKIDVYHLSNGSGQFRRIFRIPIDAVLGKHTITVCSDDPCRRGSAQLRASAGLLIVAAAPAYTGSIAYLYAKNQQPGQEYQSLLQEHGFHVQLISLDQAARIDFAPFDLVIIGADTGTDDTWGNANQDLIPAITKNPKILGIGSGGHAFFGKLDSQLGYPNGITDKTNTAVPIDPQIVFYRTQYDFSALAQEELTLYRDPTPFVAVLPSGQTAPMLSLARPTLAGDPMTDAVIAAEGCSLLWGFDGDPSQMTEVGRALFVNAVAFVLGNVCNVNPTNLCVALDRPAQIPAQAVLNFEDLPDGTVIGDSYAESHGVHFEDNQRTRAIIYRDRDNDVGKSHSPPNVATNSAVTGATSAGLPMTVQFDRAQSHVGLWLGNGKDASGNGPDLAATLTAYDTDGKAICYTVHKPVPASHTDFVGLYDALGRIASIELDYGDTPLSESLDDLVFGPFMPTNRIRVCRQGANGCVPVANARVHHIRPNDPTGRIFITNADGYIRERGRIRYGDVLWPTVEITATTHYTLFHTSADLYPVQASRFTESPSGDLEMYVDARHPLLVFDIAMATQWSLEGNPTYQARLAEDIRKAANYLYDFTDGQVMLGQVDVYQNYDNWNSSDVWIFSSNNMRPHATVGGVVETTTPDPILGPTQSYYPGHVFMGRTWNRYGLPGIPMNLDVDVSDDWALALAHEFGHYLLFLYDTYLSLTPDGVVEIDTCTGSAMGWVYEARNTEFVADEAHWATHCAKTLANQILRRTEWATILLWYQDLVTPAAVNPGPFLAPVSLTKVQFHPPSVPAVVLENQTFTLNYQDGETASGEARAFLIRNGRVLDQGKPRVGTTEIKLSGAQTDDRFCVYDVNDFIDDDEVAPRHQYGCEVLEQGDNALQMEKDASWTPVVELSPVTSTTVEISVTQAISGTPLKARLYPEHSDQSTEITLTAAGGDMHTGVFTSPVEATAAYVQIWVDETATEENPRRETMVDYGVGGSGAHGPATWFDGVPIVSSDGKAEFARNSTVFLKRGEFMALQSMAGTPRPGADKRVIGQAYRLVALPRSLATDGHVAIHIRPLRTAEIGSAQVLPDATVHYWNGHQWIPLPTEHVNDLTAGRVALAPSQGVGIYALLLERKPVEGNRLYLPHIAR